MQMAWRFEKGVVVQERFQRRHAENIVL